MAMAGPNYQSSWTLPPILDLSDTAGWSLLWDSRICITFFLSLQWVLRLVVISVEITVLITVHLHIYLSGEWYSNLIPTVLHKDMKCLYNTQCTLTWTILPSGSNLQQLCQLLPWPVGVSMMLETHYWDENVSSCDVEDQLERLRRSKVTQLPVSSFVYTSNKPYCAPNPLLYSLSLCILLVVYLATRKRTQLTAK